MEKTILRCNRHPGWCCCSKTNETKFKVKNKWVAYLFVFYSFFALSQVNQDGVVAANFGVDGDVRAGVTTFINPPQLGTGTDDWFLNSSTGRGVIDVTSADALSFINSLNMGLDNTPVEL